MENRAAGASRERVPGAEGQLLPGLLRRRSDGGGEEVANERWDRRSPFVVCQARSPKHDRPQKTMACPTSRKHDSPQKTMACPTSAARQATKNDGLSYFSSVMMPGRLHAACMLFGPQPNSAAMTLQIGRAHGSTP